MLEWRTFKSTYPVAGITIVHVFVRATVFTPWTPPIILQQLVGSDTVVIIGQILTHLFTSSGIQIGALRPPAVLMVKSNIDLIVLPRFPCGAYTFGLLVGKSSPSGKSQ